MSKINSAYNFLFHPLHKDSSRKHDRTKRSLTLIASVAAGVFSLSFSHIIVFAMHRHRAKKLDAQPNHPTPSSSIKESKKEKDPFKLANSTSSSSEYSSSSSSDGSYSDADARLAQELQEQDYQQDGGEDDVDQSLVLAQRLQDQELRNPQSIPSDEFTYDPTAFDNAPFVPSNEQKEQYSKTTSIHMEGKAKELFTTAETLMKTAKNRGELEEGIQYLIAAANKGFAEAQYQAGAVFEEEGLSSFHTNPQLVKHYYFLAAKQGHIKAQREYGSCLNKGIGGPKNVVEAEKWFKLAADQYDRQAQYYLGALLLREGKRKKEALFYLEAAAKQNELKALTVLGFCFLKGQLVEQDIDKAEEIFLDKDLENSPLAHLYLAEIYETAEGKIDIKKALLHYQLAYAHGNYDVALRKIEEIVNANQPPENN